MVKGSRLCVLRLTYLLFAIFSCSTSILVSLLHLGQYSGKLNMTVSTYTLVRVLLSQTGQRIQREVICSLSIENDYDIVFFACPNNLPLIFRASRRQQRKFTNQNTRQTLISTQTKTVPVPNPVPSGIPPDMTKAISNVMVHINNWITVFAMYGIPSDS